MKKNKILLFDGVCNLCNGVVQFIIKNENSEIIKFASLQSDFGQNLLKKHKINTSQIDSMIFISNDEIYLKSDAVLKVSKLLNSPYKYIAVFNFLPLRFRNFLYDFIAKNRYNFFGKKESCWLPTKEIMERFL